MSWKFNPPPGWPQQPEGWQPPPGWAPDPSWPAAPPGWQFWVPAGQAGSGAGPVSGGPAGSGSVHDAPTSVAATAGSPPPAAASPQSGPPQPSQPYPQSPQSQSPMVPQQYAPQPASPYPATTPAGGFPPAGPPAADAPWHHRWWVFGAAGAALLLAGCIAGSGIAFLTHSDDSEQPGPVVAGPETEPTDDDDDDNEPDPPPPAPGGSGGLAAGEQRTGQGPALVSLNLSPDRSHVVTVTFAGDGFFTAYLVDDAGEVVDYQPGSNWGSFTATHLVDVGKWGGDPVAIDIQEAEDGEWTVHLQDLNDIPAWPDVTEGEGTTVLRVDQSALTGDTAVTGTHDGQSNFIVWAYTERDFGDRLLFNEIGDYDGASQEDIPEDAVALEIRADGAWTLRP